jgi:hypothetical protein
MKDDFNEGGRTAEGCKSLKGKMGVRRVWTDYEPHTCLSSCLLYTEKEPRRQPLGARAWAERIGCMGDSVVEFHRWFPPRPTRAQQPLLRCFSHLAPSSTGRVCVNKLLAQASYQHACGCRAVGLKPIGRWGRIRPRHDSTLAYRAKAVAEQRQSKHSFTRLVSVVETALPCTLTSCYKVKESNGPC